MEYSQLESEPDKFSISSNEEEVVDGPSDAHATLHTTSGGHFRSHGHNMNAFYYGEDINELEEKWFEESQSVFRQLSWYRRPSKKVLYTILSLHSISFTILMGPLVTLMLKNICSSGAGSSDDSRPPMHAHSMNMGPVGAPKYPLPATSETTSNSLVRLFARMDMGGSPTAQCGNPNAQKTLSNIQSILSIVSGLLGFALSGKYGQWSDQYGRVFVFKIFSIINLIHTLSLIIYFDIYEHYNKTLMILLSSTGYLSGGIMTLISNGNSYLNDIMDTKERTIAISLLMSFVYLTVGVGPLLGSFAVKVTDGNDNVPLYLSLVFAVVSTVLVFTLMNESRHPDAMELAKEVYDRKINDSTDLNATAVSRVLQRALATTKGLFKPIGRLWIPKTEHGSLIPRLNVVSLVLIDVFSMAATVGTFSVMVLWTILRFHWTSVEIGYFMSLSGFGRALVLLFVAPGFLKFLEKKLHYSVYSDSVDSLDKGSILVSLFFIFISSLLLVAIPKPSVVYVSVVLQSLSGLLSPTIQSGIAKYSTKTESGEMFGAIALVRHLAMLFLPTIFLQIYSHTVDDYPNFFLYFPLVGSILLIIMSSSTLRIHHRVESAAA